MTDAQGSRPRLTRGEQQARTRRELVLSALGHFTQHGYHGARLDLIAADAGYSKGAVYSNFADKAELFLAVLDHNLSQVNPDMWDPVRHAGSHGIEQPVTPEPSEDERSEGDPTEAEAAQGFGLATLEFIGSVGRDPVGREAIAVRLEALVDAFGAFAERSRPAEEPLSVGDVGALMAALDQGAAALGLGGVDIAPEVLAAGLHRLMDPAGAASGGPSTASTTYDAELVRDLITQVRSVVGDDSRQARDDEDPSSD